MPQRQTLNNISPKTINEIQTLNPNFAAQSIRLLKQLLANETLDSQAQFDLKRLIELCGSQSIKSLFDLGFDPKKKNR